MSPLLASHLLYQSGHLDWLVHHWEQLHMSQKQVMIQSIYLYTFDNLADLRTYIRKFYDNQKCSGKEIRRLTSFEGAKPME